MFALELLAPAKDKTVGIAAIDCGADAVYIGGPGFGNRKAAGNGFEDIRELCAYAHQFGVRIYLTVNTLVYDGEWDEVHAQMLEAQDAGVDAFIFREERMLTWPDIRIPMHASTQCAIRDVERARHFDSLGCARIILERGLPLETVREICAAVSCEVEFFVHGALCVCYSGDCRLSEYLDGRSADRGDCIQACRSLYDLQDASGRTLVRNKALLSLRDFKLLDRLEELADAGVCSFKIEGRLKNASYVKNVVREYSIALDDLVARYPERYCRASFGHVTGGFAPDSDKTFNRGYTQWFLDGKRGKWSSMDAPKSMGEYIGEVASVRPSGSGLQVTVRPSSNGLVLSNGDGFAFVRQTNKAGGFGGYAPRPLGVQGDSSRRRWAGLPEQRFGGNAPRPLGVQGDSSSKPTIVGFRGDRCDGLRIFCKRTDGLRPGVRLYRNINAAFEREIEARSPRREISVDVDVRVYGDFVVELTAVSEDGRVVVSPFHTDVERAENRERAEAMLRESLGKRTGVYSFRVRTLSVETRDGALPLLSASTINSMRRLLAEDLTASRLTPPVYLQYRDSQPSDNQSVNENRLPQTEQSDSGKSLTVNHLQITRPEPQRSPTEFMEDRRAGLPEQRFGGNVPRPLGVQGDSSNTVFRPLMRTKYCIRYELGLCPRWQGAKETGPLYLINNGRRLALRFDCSRCEMTVEKT